MEPLRRGREALAIAGKGRDDAISKRLALQPAVVLISVARRLAVVVKEAVDSAYAVVAITKAASIGGHAFSAAVCVEAVRDRLGGKACPDDIFSREDVVVVIAVGLPTCAVGHVGTPSISIVGIVDCADGPRGIGDVGQAAFRVGISVSCRDIVAVGARKQIAFAVVAGEAGRVFRACRQPCSGQGKLDDLLLVRLTHQERIQTIKSAKAHRKSE